MRINSSLRGRRGDRSNLTHAGHREDEVRGDLVRLPRSLRSLAMTIVALLLAMAFSGLLTCPAFAEEAPPATDASQVDQSDSNYYWKGTQLYNLGRLGEAFESFEKAVQKGQNEKEAEAYLMQIRQEIVNRARKKAEEERVIDYSRGEEGKAFKVMPSDRGTIKVAIQGKELFEQNSTALKTGAAAILDRIAEVLTGRDGRKVELFFADEIDNLPNVKDLAAERQLTVFSYLNFKRLEIQ